ncbi:uncharacterized protein LODBEIA_P46390 [Lodderomyces beijingensis]|uniref:Uncharacterized protein n=1 Tax=Lodderomyces beijingensis TaxID=1775926 RepID=A0ABP0ZT88_9ASCO
MSEKRLLEGQDHEQCEKSRKLSSLSKGGRGHGVVDTTTSRATGKGLDVELHPLLRYFNSSSNSGSSSNLPMTKNPHRRSQREGKRFDEYSFNPYLNSSSTSSIADRKRKPLSFNKQGKFVSQGDKLREKLKIEDEARQMEEDLARRGLLADTVLGEDSYQARFPPMVEWWDKWYLRDSNYSRISEDGRLELENDEQPITVYIQHPVLHEPLWEQGRGQKDGLKPMFLTAKERKRIRKNDRQIRHKELQDRIKLGLEAPPPPKVKLSNLMNVLTNEAIRDPTAVEQRVKKQVEQRLAKHLQVNEERKLTKEQKHAKLYAKQEQDLAKGIYSTVFKINSLANPSNFFKVDVNAQQNNLFGICLKNPKFNLVVVEGGEKSIRQYKKLVMNRIPWSDAEGDAKSNYVRVLWEGKSPQLHFEKWSIMYSRNDEEALKVLDKFGMSSYWSLAQNL